MAFNKLTFRCNACGCEGTIKIDDEHEITNCPSCGNVFDIDDDDDDDVYGYEN